jgi:hypothetical protein
MVWCILFTAHTDNIMSNVLLSLNAVAACSSLVQLELQCPSMQEAKVPPLPPTPVASQPVHPPIAAMLKV